MFKPSLLLKTNAKSNFLGVVRSLWYCKDHFCERVGGRVYVQSRNVLIVGMQEIKDGGMIEGE